ncbi:MAG: FtsQ-type POTRA domain-containing protein [Ignavibacteriaceae bacterium]|nr:FtsQ-type POTRA domain-containing protein [Ignavibacteriaceae bacterium]MCU0406065.1 FtsQ-type POTRA domain-containing protein [Ignavibacteriaceae bacterium]MCU0413987.1 FtsQ-type POTRA domain-containing protein [Ignavibacteriaceae bacterium]
MSERRSKFFGLVVFLVLIIGFSYLMITGSKASHKQVYNQIEITENTLLPAKEYLRYAGLSDSTKYENLTLLEVKTKIEKHPYLRKAEVEFDGVNKILVEVQEKEIKAALLQKNELKLITGDLETLPLFPPSKIKDLPVISNMGAAGKNENSLRNMEFAFRIIDAISMSDTNVRKLLAEINLRKSGDAILTFTGFNFPVLFGKSDEVKKALILKNLWQQLFNEEIINGNTEYLDLRYKNKVFIGKRKTELISG